MSKSLILIGLGGHAKVLIDIIEQFNMNVIGYVAPKKIENVYNMNYLGTDESVTLFSSNEVLLVNTIGSVGDMSLRGGVYNKFKSLGYSFQTIIHSSAYISPRSQVGEGSQIMANAVIQPFARIEENTIINSNSVIEHGSIISNNCHVAPGVTISGDVTVNEYSHIGAGSTVIQGIEIGKNVLVGAGAVVTRNVMDGLTVVGIPARRQGNNETR